MKLIFITEARYLQLTCGKLYSLESSFGMSLYERYLRHFDEVLIIARLKIGSENEVIKNNLISDERVKILGLPYYVGFWQFISKYLKLKAQINDKLKEIVSSNSVIICRIPGRIGSISIGVLRNLKVPYGVEVVGDPYDLFARGVIKHPLRIALRYLATTSLKNKVWKAPAALYVTQVALQRRYPSPNFNLGVSDVALASKYFADQAKTISDGKMIRLISIGSLDQMYKSPDVVLKALRILKSREVKCSLSWIGDGKYMNHVKQIAIDLGIEKDVHFFGKLPAGESVRDELCKSDIFLLISRTEGLPRAMIEAMACGLPCIGTPVGGIPELIGDDFLVEINDPVSLANKIQVLINAPQIARQQAIKNLLLSHEYEESKLELKRMQFYDYLKQLLEKSSG